MGLAAAVLVLLGVGLGALLRGTSQTEGYRDGLRDGRAVQLTLSLPPGSRDAARAAFDAGYAAGANDVFSGYDGGWGLSTPYFITLSQGTGGVTYRIDTRTPLREGVNYYLCPRTHKICQEPRP
jgi:hypothetical protein